MVLRANPLVTAKTTQLRSAMLKQNTNAIIKECGFVQRKKFWKTFVVKKIENVIIFQFGHLPLSNYIIEQLNLDSIYKLYSLVKLISSCDINQSYIFRKMSIDENSASLSSFNDVEIERDHLRNGGNFKFGHIA